MFLAGCLLSIVLIIIGISIASRYVNIYRVDYELILKEDDGTVCKMLSAFSRYYWNKSSYEKDVQKLKLDCSHLRDDIITNDDFLLSLINEQFQVDMANVYISSKTTVIKPRH